MELFPNVESCRANLWCCFTVDPAVSTPLATEHDMQGALQVQGHGGLGAEPNLWRTLQDYAHRGGLKPDEVNPLFLLLMWWVQYEIPVNIEPRMNSQAFPFGFIGTTVCPFSGVVGSWMTGLRNLNLMPFLALKHARVMQTSTTLPAQPIALPHSCRSYCAACPVFSPLAFGTPDQQHLLVLSLRACY